MRIFAAVVPPPDAITEVATATFPAAAGWPGLRWSGPDAWHVTLAFLGEVDPGLLDALGQRLERAASRHPSVHLRIAGAGAFPAALRATVVWAGIDGDRKALGDVAASVAAGARRAGAPAADEGRRFRPHLTLARCREPTDVRPVLAALAPLVGSSWAADHIHLIRSHLGRPPRYEIIASWPLRSRPDGGT